MLSKLSRNLSSGISGSLGLQNPQQKSMVKATLTHRTRDRARKSNLKTTSPSHRKRRVNEDEEGHWKVV
jgi:hypothetical protein